MGAESKAVTFFQQNKKAVTVGASLLGAVLLWKIYDSRISSSGTAEDPTGNVSLPPGTTTVENFDAKGIADQLEQLMWDSWPTDNDAVLSLLTGVSQDKFGLVVAAFGKRKYNSFFGNNGLWGSDQPLKDWLKNEVNSSTYSALKSKYPNYL